MNGRISKALLGLAAVASAAFLTSCGGGGDSDDQYNGAAPLSLNGVTFSFPNAVLTFSSPSPNGAVGGVETGGIVYLRANDAAFSWAPVDPNAVDAVELTWPLDIGASTRYQYTQIDENRGELRIYAASFEAGTFLYHPEGEDLFDVFTCQFNSNGAFVTDSFVEILGWSQGEQYTSTREAELSISGLTDNPQPLPLGWDGVNNGQGFIAPASFEGRVMTMTENGTGDQIQLLTFIPNPTGPIPPPQDRDTETGTCAVSITIGGILNTYSATYTHEQLYGTEDVVFTVEYVSGTGSLPTSPEVFTFTFFGGESLSAGDDLVPVRTGEYVSNRRGPGQFVLDIN